MIKRILRIIFLTFLFFSAVYIIRYFIKDEFIELHGTVYGSTFSIKYESDKDYSAEVDSIFKNLDYILSTYREDSEISRWNNGNDTLNLSKDFIELFKASYKINKLTDGYFDPTVKPLVDAWGFGNKEKINSPDSIQILDYLTYVGFNKIELKGNTLFKKNPKIQIDFNSIAPGYTADLVGDFLLEKGVQNFLVDIGGEICAHGKHNHKDWLVGIDNPLIQEKQTKAFKTKTLKNEGLAVSGNYRKIRKDENGNNIVHTLNPKTGYTATSKLLSIAIISKKTTDADAIATACMAMGYEKAKKFVTENKIPALLLSMNDDKIQSESLNGF